MTTPDLRETPHVHGFHHLAIQVADLVRGEAFYGELLGLRAIARWADEAGRPRSIWLGLPGGGFLALERSEGTPEPRPFRDGRPGLHLLALGIRRDDRAALEERLAAAGHPKVAETAYTFYVLDPEGNRVGLSHYPEPR